jgi:hypothetical protein
MPTPRTSSVKTAIRFTRSFPLLDFQKQLRFFKAYPATFFACALTFAHRRCLNGGVRKVVHPLVVMPGCPDEH